MVDLTKIEKPFGLLDAQTQEALRAWPHGVEFFNNVGRWRDALAPDWSSGLTYRAKPAPVTPRVAYVNYYSDRVDPWGPVLATHAGAFATRTGGGQTLRMVEDTSWKS